MAIALGMEPVRALRMASINAARIYGLKNIGAVAPGWQADLVVFDNLESLKPLHVFHKGEDAVALGETVNFTPAPAALAGSVHPAPFTEDAFAISRFATDKLYPVIQMLEGEIFTERGEMHGSEVAEALAAGRVHLIAVIERHNGTGNIGLGLLQGYGLRNGAAATTVAHDSHNLIVIGSSPADMFIATQELIRVQGGYTLVKEGKVVGTVPLDIGGLMSSLSTEELANSLDDIKIKAHAQGVPQGVDPFISLSFMALPVIPRLRITDMGMFDVDKFAFCE